MTRPSLRGALAAALCLTPAWATASVPARAALQPVEVRLTPEAPVQGALFRVTVTPGEPAARPEGRFAGERLHFRAGEEGWVALAAMPVDAEGELPLELDVEGTDGRPARLERPVPVAAGRYAMERLTVAPRFGAPLSPELARRTAEESARAMAVAREAHDTPRLWEPGTFVRPRPTPVTSGYGNGREFNGQVQSRHMGTDFRGAVGEPVLAAARGVVRVVDAFYLGGNVVYLDHGAGLSTGYLHLSETRVAAGDTVQAGQRIGSVGATGRVTGPHLHWILRYGDVTVDPLSVLELPPG